MCLDPVSLGISLALSGAGAGISRYEADQNASAKSGARNSVLSDYLQRQRGLSNQGRDVFNDRLADFQQPTQGASLATSQADRTADVTKNIAAPVSDNVTVSGSAPSVVKGEIAKRMLESFKGATASAKAMGKVGGYGDRWQGNNLGINDASRRIGTINNFAQGNSAILPSQQDLAEIGATESPSIFGPLLSMAGNVMGGAAGRGFSLFGPPTGGVLPGGLPLGQGGIGSA